MTPENIQIVKESAAVLGENAEALTRLFYQRMFEGDPQVKAYFNEANQHKGEQQQALAGAVVAYATNIEDPSVLGSAVELIAHKHVSLGIQPDHYPIVGKHLLGAIKELLGDLATDKLINAWAEAYGQLADIMIGRETDLYEQQKENHGWTGFRKFKVDRKVTESDEITSFYLVPVDGSPISPHLPGQYLTVRLDQPADNQHTTMRNYSISSAPGETWFRISVKREPSTDTTPAGAISNRLHDSVAAGELIDIAPPSGEFTLDTTAETTRPLVLLSGGVGITPMLSMLHAAVQQKTNQKIVFIHGARNRSVHAFADEVQQLASGNPNVTVHFRLGEVDDPVPGLISKGFIDLSLIEQLVGTPDADFYFCGPKPFMDSISKILTGWNVPESQIRFEDFGPSSTLTRIVTGCPFSSGAPSGCPALPLGATENQ